MKKSERERRLELELFFGTFLGAGDGYIIEVERLRGTVPFC
jgi:hypothetical protein